MAWYLLIARLLLRDAIFRVISAYVLFAWGLGHCGSGTVSGSPDIRSRLWGLHCTCPSMFYTCREFRRNLLIFTPIIPIQNTLNGILVKCFKFRLLLGRRSHKEFFPVTHNCSDGFLADCFGSRFLIGSFFFLVSWLIFDICSPIYVCPIGLPRFYILPRNRGICSCFVWSKLVTFVTSCIIYGSSSDTAIGMISRSTAVLRHCSAHIRLVIATWLLYLLLLYLFLALVDSVSQRVSWPGSMWGEL